VYLSRESLDVSIVTSKSSEMNVAFPDANDEMIERPIPEQFVARIEQSGNTYSIVTGVSELYSH
jgi:adenylyl cyclase-associated protein